MKPEPHFHTIIVYFLQEAIVFPVLQDLSWFVNLYERLYEWVNWEVSQYAQVLLVVPGDLVILVYAVVALWQFPNQQESFPNVFVRRASVLVDCFMDDGADLVNKEQNILLQDLVDLIEPPNITKPKNGTFLRAFNHGIHIPFLNNILPNNLCACTTKNNTQQNPNLYDRIADNSCLIKCI